MKELVTTYVFSASANTVTSTSFSSLESILLITNVSRNTILYNFADNTLGGSLVGNVLTLIKDCSSMSDSDLLQIFIDTPNTDFEYLNALLASGLAEIVHQLQSIRNDGGMADAAGRVRIAIESGSVGISSSQTLANVTTIANLTNIGTQNGTLFLINGSNVAAQNLRNKIVIS